MSDSASFWAAKSNGVKSPPRQPRIAQRDAPKRSTAVLKSSSNGVKKANWADSDDEEEFLASFTSSTRIGELEKTIAAKNALLTDLETSLQEKYIRIIELGATLEEQQLRLTELQGVVDASAAQIEELKKENHKQFLHVQKLVADVDEKDRRISALETEVDEHCATIAEFSVGDNSTQASSNEASEILQIGPTDDKSYKTENKDKEVLSSEHMVQQKIKEVDLNGTSGIPSTKTTPLKAKGPTVNLSGFPIFSTPATVKQVAPPPPAPKLRMPVDLTKFAKKPVTKTPASKTTVKAVSANAAEDGPAPKMNPSADIRTKSLAERSLFANGPKVVVKMGETYLATVPKYILMQCSSKAFRHLSDNPDATSFSLPDGSMDVTAATAHLTWMKEMTFQGRVYSITLHSDEKFDDKNLQICRAARVLGLHSMYVGHFTKIFCDRIRSNNAVDGFLRKVVAAAYPDNDPIYDCLANNLANLRLRKTIENPAELEALLQQNEGLKIKVEKIEERMRQKQNGAKPAKAPKVVRVGKSMGV
ncbi:hypothetical protein C7974DRAFT_453215 [Boeremia exigua]|uniref:uncharacterized protein n=1 Tax=Boeremia exigua TaxID=749465 RepID=UPI001E8D7AAA|nr:uncharacterized protein C7974DRAFT_453215 [Boeremia exigua]KAH6633710.1 hypothetical protein C7974DRAFT_453215 [Boeremia exigua]